MSRKQRVFKSTRTGRVLERRERMFYWKGTSFSGLVDDVENALFDNPDDSFYAHVGMKTSLDLGLVEEVLQLDEAALQLKMVAAWLEGCLHDISESQWCAGWYCDIEFFAWAWINGDRRWRVGPEVMLKEMRWAAEKYGVWVRWAGDEGVVAVPMAEWVQIFAEWKQKNGAEKVPER